jgi:peptidoglycan/LPS O-acetylase OafA/YrhL
MQSREPLRETGAAPCVGTPGAHLENMIATIFRALHQRMATKVVTSKISPHTSQVLDAARALAAGLVVLFHAKIYAFGSASLPPWYQLLYAPANCGSPAVFWFFVISGYLVGGSVIAEVAQTGSFDFRRYLINRMTRLYIVLLPALALGAFLDSARIATWGANAHAGFETAASLSGVTVIGNVLYLQTLVVSTFGSNWVLWSLANEFWYYVTFPLLLAPVMVNRPLLQRMLLFMLGVAIMLFISKHNISMSWLFTLWCLGAAIRFAAVRPSTSQTLAWSIAAAAMLAFPYLHPWIGLLSTLLVAVTFAIAVLATHRQSAPTEGRMATFVKIFSGFSFSLYLVHLPLQHFVATEIGRGSDPFLNASPGSVTGPGFIIALVGTSYAAAFLFSRVTEGYTEALRRLLLARFHRPAR